MKSLLVVCSQKENYFELFKGKTLSSGEGIIVEQAPWVDLQVSENFHQNSSKIPSVSYPDNLLVNIRPNAKPFPGTEQHKFRTFCPDFVLLRSYALGNHEHDWRKKIYAFYHHDIPCLNSIDSFVWSVEKALHYTKLKRVVKVMPDFPLIPQIYYSHPHVASFPPDFPCVLKVGSSSQGVGKARIMNPEQWRDTLSLLAMTTEYFVTEPFVEWKADVRVQKIGNHYRAISRKKTSEQSPWKANEPIGISEEDVPVLPRWQKWLDAASEVLDMSMCGMDLLITKDGKEYILEVNSSSIGFPARHAEEDCGYIRDLVLEKMNETFSPALLKERQNQKLGKKTGELRLIQNLNLNESSSVSEEEKKSPEKKVLDPALARLHLIKHDDVLVPTLFFLFLVVVMIIPLLCVWLKYDLRDLVALIFRILNRIKDEILNKIK